MDRRRLRCAVLKAGLHGKLQKLRIACGASTSKERDCTRNRKYEERTNHTAETARGQISGRWADNAPSFETPGAFGVANRAYFEIRYGKAMAIYKEPSLILRRNLLKDVMEVNLISVNSLFVPN